LRPVPDFDPALLPEPVRPWIVDLAERLQVPADYPAAAWIVMFAAVLGRRVFVRPHRYDDWVVFPNLWGAIIGRSGVMKSPVVHAVIGPLRRRQALAIAIYESERETYQRLLQAHRLVRRNGRTRIRADEFEGLSGAEPGPPTPPVCTRYLINEATIERVHLVLKENPQGVLYLRDELSGWVSQLNQRDRAFFLETWSGNGDFTFDRIGRGMVHAPHLCLSVLGGLQPAPLQQYLADAVTGGAGDDGFLQRFQVMVWPDIHPEWEAIDRRPEVQAERKVEQTIDRLLGLSPEDPLRTYFDESAQEVFIHWRKELERRIRSGNLGPALESHLAKSRSLMPKLALIFHLAEGGTDPAISYIAAERAVQYCDYLESHACRIYGSVVSRPLRLAARLGQRMRAGQLSKQFKLSDIYLRGWPGLDTPENARIAISVLLDAGWIRPIRKQSSVEAPQYTIHPKI
jgi:putative DNA primase/helicase